MDVEERTQIRHATQSNRRPPQCPARILATFDAGHDFSNDASTAPIDLTVEVTNSDLELAPWLNDDWWAEAIHRWADCPLTVHVAPTQGALLHPVVLHHLEMLRRVTPQWRLVGHAFADDVSTDDAIDRLATSPYHEVRFVDQARPGSPRSERRTWTMSIPELLGRIRAAQSRVGASTPILVRLPATRPACTEDTEDGSAETTERTGNAAVSTGRSTPKPNRVVREDSHADNGSPQIW